MPSARFARSSFARCASCVRRASSRRDATGIVLLDPERLLGEAYAETGTEVPGRLEPRSLTILRV